MKNTTLDSFTQYAVLRKIEGQRVTLDYYAQAHNALLKKPVVAYADIESIEPLNPPREFDRSFMASIGMDLEGTIAKVDYCSKIDNGAGVVDMLIRHSGHVTPGPGQAAKQPQKGFVHGVREQTFSEETFGESPFYAVVQRLDDDVAILDQYAPSCNATLNRKMVPYSEYDTLVPVSEQPIERKFLRKLGVKSWGHVLRCQYTSEIRRPLGLVRLTIRPIGIITIDQSDIEAFMPSPEELEKIGQAFGSIYDEEHER